MSFAWSHFRRHPLVKALASLKLAVFVILAFIMAMIAGTLMESLYGRDFAKRAVYDSIPFWIVLSLLFVNILFAALVRLPFQKRLAGFYTIHLGLLTVLIGALTTARCGLDGVMELFPNQPNHRVLVPESRLYLTAYDQKEGESQQMVFSLPDVISEQRPEIALWRVGEYDIFLDRYLPYADSQVDWQDRPNGAKDSQVLWITIGNERFREEIQLGNVEGYLPEQQAGPLSLKLFPSLIQDELGQLPSLGLSRESPYLVFLQGGYLAYGKGFDWKVLRPELFQEIPLPWMNLRVTVMRRIENKQPVYTFKPSRPTGPDDDKDKAVLLRIVDRRNPDRSELRWAGETAETRITFPDRRFAFFIGQKIHTLQFALSLERFHMQTNPGTDEPASYESFVKVVRDAPFLKDAHVYMNHPLKEERYTFYQSSYFPLTDKEGYGSVFSVNYDPGRPIKYTGSALVVFGAILHYYLRRQKRQDVDTFLGHIAKERDHLPLKEYISLEEAERRIDLKK